jgi:hypothetical protein
VGQWIAAVVYALAVARISRLITDDKILEAPRNAVLARTADESLAAYLITCRWCVSFWVAAPAAAVWYFWPLQPWFLVPTMALAFSHVTGLLTGLEDS